jgi:hypothetical protein
MRPDILPSAAAVALLLCTGTAVAQEQSAGKTRSSPGGKITAPVSGELTGKERLGRKWMDEQRIDNCKVPAELRGSKPRPDKCHNQPPA